MVETDEDNELVKLAQGGDARAFEALVVKYQRRVARHVARYIRASGDVEDVVQQTFIRAYRGLASFRGDSAFYSWLYRIATNAALTHLKREPHDVAHTATTIPRSAPTRSSPALPTGKTRSAR